MSSDSDAPYQSRLLNFLNRRSINWKDRLGRTIRYAKVATIWGVQILLYPAYLLVQTGRVIKRQLGKKVAQSQLRLSPSSPNLTTSTAPSSLALDAPIEPVLKTVVSWFSFKVQAKALIQSLRDSAIVAVNPNPIQSQSPVIEPEMIKGVACLRETHTLVLVSQDNQILDVLSATQQQQLQKRISWEVANYLHHQRLIQPTPWVNRLPKLPTHHPHLIPPVRWFYQGISWLQISPVASAINLFGESSLAHSVTDSPSQSPELTPVETIPLLTQFSSTEFFLSLDSTLVNLEQALPQLQQQFPADLTTIKDLIKSVLDDFWDSQPSVAENGNSPASSLTYPSNKNSSLTQENITLEDPWLSWGNSGKEGTIQVNSDSDLANFNQSNSNPKLLPQSSSRSIKELIKSKLSWKGRAKISPLSKIGSQELALSPHQPHQITQSVGRQIDKIEVKETLQLDIPVSVSESENHSGELSSDVVETQVTTVGYAKNPLVRLIEWFDQKMLKIEDFLIGVWQKIRPQD